MKNFHSRRQRRTRREVVPLVARLRLAVQFLLSQLVQQTLVLVLLSRQGCPLMGKVCNAAGAVTVMALKKRKKLRRMGKNVKIQCETTCLSTANRLHFSTFGAPVLSFVPPAAALAGGLAARGEVGLGGRLAPALVGLCDGRRVGRVGHAAEAFLRAPVKVLRRVGALGGEGGRGGGRLLGLLQFVGVRLLQPAGRSRFLNK